jgi:AcrB/AcrD/AcrF family
MTAAAMIVGMTPMAIGGPGEEQNSALAHAVIGGVVVGTITTLLFEPYLYLVIVRFDRQLAVLATQRDAVPLVHTMTAKAETEPRIIVEFTMPVAERV